MWHDIECTPKSKKSFTCSYSEGFLGSCIFDSLMKTKCYFTIKKDLEETSEK